MAPRITATIDNLDEEQAMRMAQAGAGLRYEVVFDYLDGDHHELEAHFRLAELTAAKGASGRVTFDLAGFSGLPPGTYHGTVERVHYRLGAPYPAIEVMLADPPSSRAVSNSERETYASPREPEVIHVGSTSGRGPEFAMFAPGKPPQLNAVRLAELLEALIRLTGISPRVLGIPGGEGPLDERIYYHLTREDHMGKHTKPGPDPKPNTGPGIPASGGGKHEDKGGGKGGK